MIGELRLLDEEEEMAATDIRSISFWSYGAENHDEAHQEQAPRKATSQSSDLPGPPNDHVRVSIVEEQDEGRQEHGLGTASFLTPKMTSSSTPNAATRAWFCPNREGKKRVVVLGSGDFGLALTSKLVQASFCVIVASRNPSRTRQRVSELGATVLSQHEALKQSNVVVMAVPFHHMPFLPLRLLAGKILIDVSNRNPKERFCGISQAEQLQTLVPTARVVKAFNVLSAYALTRSNIGSKEVPVCGNDEAARQVVCGMARDLRLTPIDCGGLTSARKVEKIPLSFFPSWTNAFILSWVCWIFFFLLTFLQWQLCDHLKEKSSDWSSLARLPTYNIAVSCACTSLTLLALCYLPGVVAAYLQLARGTKYSEFPRWLDRWLKGRKQLGLLMLLNAVIHAFLKMSGSSVSFNSPWRISVYIATGNFSLVLAGILGLTSLPSVSSVMTWREFTFIQSVLGWVTLLLSTAHLIFARWDNLISPDFTCYLPSSGQFVMVIPLVTLVLKVPLLLPCVNNCLTSIRQGYDTASARPGSP